jgi:hypothetical protein
LTSPNAVASNAVVPEPVMAPVLAPPAMKANMRLACSRSNRSAMKLQNTDTTNRLNTLTQTKKTRAVQTSSAWTRNTTQKASRFRMKKP